MVLANMKSRIILMKYNRSLDLGTIPGSDANGMINKEDEFHSLELHLYVLNPK